MSILSLEQLSKHFRGLVAVDGLDLQLNLGELVGLIGPNGAGKTSGREQNASSCHCEKFRPIKVGFGQSVRIFLLFNGVLYPSNSEDGLQ